MISTFNDLSKSTFSNKFTNFKPITDLIPFYNPIVALSIIKAVVYKSFLFCGLIFHIRFCNIVYFFILLYFSQFMDTQELFWFWHGGQIFALNWIIKDWWLAFASDLPRSKFIFFVFLRYGSNATCSSWVRVRAIRLCIEVWLKWLDIFRPILFIASGAIHTLCLFYTAIITLIDKTIWTVLLRIPCRIILLYLAALYLYMRLASRWMELLIIILLIHWFCNILLR